MQVFNLALEWPQTVAGEGRIDQSLSSDLSTIESSALSKMAPHQAADVIDPDRVGPHPSYIEIAKPYVFQHTITESLTAAGVSEAKDDSIRLQGVAWIDSVRKYMQL